MIDFNDVDLAKNLTDAFLKPSESNNYKILEIERGQIEAYIDDLHDIYSMLNIDVAYGATLDRYGERVGLPRGDATDEQYRVMIKAKIMRSLGNGTYPSVIKSLCATFNSEDEETDIYESDIPCTVENAILPFSALQESGMTMTQIMELIETLLPITVTLGVLDLTGTLEFSDAEDEYDELKGFANDDGSIGGYFGCTSRDTTIPIT